VIAAAALTDDEVRIEAERRGIRPIEELERLNDCVASLTKAAAEWKGRAEVAEAKLAGRSADLSRMTLAELEQTAERMGKAVATIREAQSLLGAPTERRPSADRSAGRHPAESLDEESAPADPAAAHRARQFQPVDASIPRELRMPSRPRMSSAEEAQRRALLGNFEARAPVDPNLPPEIAAMEQGEPPQ